MDYLAIAHVTYDPITFLDEMKEYSPETIKAMLKNFSKLSELEGDFLVNKNYRLERISTKKLLEYQNKLPKIEAEINPNWSTLEYLLRSDLSIPSAHVITTNGSLQLAEILLFDKTKQTI